MRETRFSKYLMDSKDANRSLGRGRVAQRGMNICSKACEMISYGAQKKKRITLWTHQCPNEKETAHSNRRVHGGFIYKRSVYKGVGIREGKAEGMETVDLLQMFQSPGWRAGQTGMKSGCAETVGNLII